jgi:hypothetical protein
LRSPFVLVPAIALCIATLLAPPAFAGEPPPGDPDPPIAGAALAGIATLVLPLAVGTSILAQGDALDHPQLSFHVIDAGFALAPLVTHAILGEGRRGLFFSAISAGLALSTSLFLENSPDLIQHGEVATRVPFAVLFSLALFSSGIGVGDCFFARDRAASARVALVPMRADGALGLGLGGVF